MWIKTQESEGFQGWALDESCIDVKYEDAEEFHGRASLIRGNQDYMNRAENKENTEWIEV